MTQQTNIREYADIIGDLKTTLNGKGKQKFHKQEKVLSLIKELKTFKESYGIMNFQISKQFLKGLYDGKTARQKANNLYLLLKGLEKVVLKKDRYFRQVIFKTYQTTAKGYNNFLYTAKNNYSNAVKIGKIYTARKKKSYDFLVLDADKIKQIHKNNQEMIIRGRALFPEFVLSNFFNLNG